MTRKINDFTPKQFAHDLAAGWIAAVYNRQTSDLADLSDWQESEVRRHLAQLHERLLSEAKLDGLPLR